MNEKFRRKPENEKLHKKNSVDSDFLPSAQSFYLSANKRREKDLLNLPFFSLLFSALFFNKRTFLWRRNERKFNKKYVLRSYVWAKWNGFHIINDTEYFRWNFYEKKSLIHSIPSTLQPPPPTPFLLWMIYWTNSTFEPIPILHKEVQIDWLTLWLPFTVRLSFAFKADWFKWNL